MFLPVRDILPSQFSLKRDFEKIAILFSSEKLRFSIIIFLCWLFVFQDSRFKIFLLSYKHTVQSTTSGHNKITKLSTESIKNCVHKELLASISLALLQLTTLYNIIVIKVSEALLMV